MNGMTAQKVAVLDLGTNTFNLLLVKITPSAYYIFHNEKVPVMIGKGGINQGVISAEAQERALQALHYYKKIIDAENIHIIYGFATSAFRDAAGRCRPECLAERQALRGAARARLRAWILRCSRPPCTFCDKK